ASKIAHLLRGVAYERETPARGRLRCSRGARDGHAVGRVCTSRLEEIAQPLPQNPPVSWKHRSDVLERLQETCACDDDLRIFSRRDSELLAIAVVANDVVAASSTVHRLIRQESPSQYLELTLRFLRDAQRSR